MNTELYARLIKEVNKIPAIDTHVHINPAALLAKNLAQVLYYHNYVSELISGGAPESLHENEILDPVSRVKAFVPEMKRSSCSAHAWMLRELLKTVYGFNEKLTEKNWESLYETADKKSCEPGRVKEVCKMAGVEKVLIHLPAAPVEKSGLDKSIFVGLSDLEIPVVPGAKSIATLEKQTGASISSANDMLNAVVSYLKRGAECGQRGVRIGISPTLKLTRPGRAAVERSFDRLITGRNCLDEDRAIVETFALDAVLTGAAETDMVVQVFVEGSFFGAQRIPSSEQSLAASIHGLVTDHPNVNFEVYSISWPLTQTLCLYCKYLKNFYLPGIWWLCQFPEIMKNSYSLRFDMLPPVKWSAFFSDSYEVEWIVGKAAITRKELSWVLSQKVIEGYMTEEDALVTARQVLYESPKRLYKLD